MAQDKTIAYFVDENRIRLVEPQDEDTDEQIAVRTFLLMAMKRRQEDDGFVRDLYKWMEEAMEEKAKVH